MALYLLPMLSFNLALSFHQTEPPLFQNLPFISIWNAPTDQCLLENASFQAFTSPKSPGQFLALFYENKLGFYPKFDTVQLKQFFGGLPQNGNLTAHLAKAVIDIDKHISQDSSPGLAVIDWEGWRPLWDQNWMSKRIYQNLSILKLLLEDERDLCDTDVIDQAKTEFESAGKRFMEETLKLGKKKRPCYKWGFYLFPDCYNYNWDKTDYTGKCSQKTQEQNNDMLWLWRSSTALFPSIYIDLKLRNSPRVALFARNRVQEALRVAALASRTHTAPVYVYTRPLYREQNVMFLSQTDLVHTVGESAALGAAGIVMWGSSVDYNNQAMCDSLSSYMSSTMGPYLANVTAATILCSQVLCQSKGRCVRKNYNSAHYLHLSPTHFRILKCKTQYVAVGLASSEQLHEWAQHFTCQCYSAQSCVPKLRPPNTIQEIWIQHAGG